MSTPLFPHAETIALLAEHLAARSVRAARCYSLAKEASQNGLHQHAATLVDEARGHTAKADSYRASMRQLCVMPAPQPDRVVPLVKPEDRAWHTADTLPPPGPEVPLPSAHVTVHGNKGA